MLRDVADLEACNMHRGGGVAPVFRPPASAEVTPRTTFLARRTGRLLNGSCTHYPGGQHDGVDQAEDDGGAFARTASRRRALHESWPASFKYTG